MFLTAFVQRFPPHATPKPAINDDDALQPNHLYNGIKLSLPAILILVSIFCGTVLHPVHCHYI
jgi:hypothetical protein